MFELCPNCNTETPISSYRHRIDNYISYYMVTCHKCGELWQHEWVLPHTFVNKLEGRRDSRKQHHRERLVRVIGNGNREKKTVAVASFSLMLIALTTFTLAPSLMQQYTLGQPSPFPESSPFSGPSPDATPDTESESATEAVAGDNLLRVGMFLFGLENDTGNVVTFVTANNITKAGADTAAVLDLADNSTDGIGEVYYSFPEISTNVGDKFEACALKVNDQSIECTPGFKTPGNRTEVAQLLIGSVGS